jgi:putative endonuclease
LVKRAFLDGSAEICGGQLKKMHFVYVLRSLRNSKHYVGFTSNNPLKRLDQHNAGANQWTKRNGPFELILSEEYEIKAEAIRREKFLKTGSGRAFLRNKLKI